MNINKFAFNVGRIGRKVREAATPFHKAYTRATPEQAAQLRKEWMLGHLTGQGLKAAERILSKGKSAGADTDHIKAIDRASSDFRYMVVRPVKTETDGAGMADPVAALLKAYAELTGAQKRKFKASI